LAKGGGGDFSVCKFLICEELDRLLIICPASIRKQLALEIEEKFNLPTAGAEASQSG